MEHSFLSFVILTLIIADAKEKLEPQPQPRWVSLLHVWQSRRRIFAFFNKEKTWKVGRIDDVDDDDEEDIFFSTFRRSILVQRELCSIEFQLSGSTKSVKCTLGYPTKRYSSPLHSTQARWTFRSESDLSSAFSSAHASLRQQLWAWETIYWTPWLSKLRRWD